MKFEELQENLQKDILPAYIINGGESYLTTQAAQLIEKKLNITLPEFNKVIIGDDYTNGMSNIVASCQALPIIDSWRLIVVNDYLGKKNESEKKIFLNYLNNPNPSTCVVFFSTNKSEFFDSLSSKIECIECEKVSDKYLINWVKEKLSRCNLDTDLKVIQKLIEFCNNSITKLDIEIDKLSSVKNQAMSRNITDEDIENYITKDIEYIIFDLSNAICKKDKDRVYLLVDTMLKNKEQPVTIISLLTNHFRRLFFISRSTFYDKQLAEYLGVKEFAVPRYREQLRNFTQRELKNIFDKCVEVEFDVKSGKMEGRNAINYLIAFILK